MKKLLFLLIAINLFGYELKVMVKNLRNSDGDVIFCVYNKNGSIPDQKLDKYYLKKIGTINNNSSEVTFNNIPQGKYAVTILHDENKNGKIDKGFILPLEGFGVSGYKSINLMHKPNFIDGSFLFNSDKNIQVKIIYL
jgi:uncharacterized protein (DUF2141 family)